MKSSTTQTSATQTSTVAAIAGPTRFMTRLAGMLVNDIDASQFADRLGTTINHPAFVLGHCAYYAGTYMRLIGGEIELSENEKILYEMGVECQDDASLYPAKDDAIATFNDRINTVADFIESCDESVLARSSEGAWFADHFPTMGGGAVFMLIGHITYHLGQISAWRRVAGMGEAD